ncbi:PIN domain-containing protein [Paraburkholderia phymatum]|nr:PIN domain-containing protein [Paraburkholderia phymatum]
MKDVEVVSDGEALSAQTRNRARQRFDHWVEWVRATVLGEAEFASIGEVMRRYEASEPPFSAAGNKKHEFPDAVALSTLEGWARASGTKVLAVTQDKDWKRYGEQSARVVMVDDLAGALSAFQRRAEAREVARRIGASLGKAIRLGWRQPCWLPSQSRTAFLNLISRLTRHTLRFTMKASTSPFRSWKFLTRINSTPSPTWATGP